MIKTTLDTGMLDPSAAHLEALQEQRFSSFLEAAPDAVVIVDQGGKIVRVNGQTERMFGHCREELLGQEVEILMPERFRGSHRGQRSAFMAHPGTRPMGPALELWGLRKDGSEFPVEISLSPIPDREGILVASIVRDVTRRRQMEQELRNADRMKDEFLATLGHELRNPLAPIRNAVELLGIEDLKEPDMRTAREMIARQVKVMVRLIDDLLNMSRISRNQLEICKERVELAAVVESAVEGSRPLIQQCGHALTVSLPTQPVPLDADPIRIAQVFVNLLNNAAKYTNRGGHIWLTAERQGSDAVVSVRDNGIGIPGDMLSRIFDMFTQVNQSREQSQGGLGIGLTLVRRLVEMHDGSIEARSNGPDAGSEFVVRLPAYIQPPQKPLPRNDGPRASALSGCRILVVDDNEDSADIMGMLLRLKGNDIRIAHDGLAALEAAETFHPEFVLLDIGLPKLNGYEVARRVRQQPWGRDVILVALTGWGQDEDRVRSLEAGFNFHMVKPVALAALEELLAGYVQAADRR
ncbi:MAG TPA: ATP-binding protein [Pirellulaceae bacterium]|nr:ATP-binding protein [Pirellulaceae bacterium]